MAQIQIRNRGWLKSYSSRLSDLMDDVIAGINANSNASVTIVENEVPQGVIDGVNKTFRLKNTPNPSTSVKLYKGGVRITAFSVNGNLIVYQTAPAIGQTHICDYRA